MIIIYLYIFRYPFSSDHSSFTNSSIIKIKIIIGNIILNIFIFHLNIFRYPFSSEHSSSYTEDLDPSSRNYFFLDILQSLPIDDFSILNISNFHSVKHIGVTRCVTFFIFYFLFFILFLHSFSYFHRLFFWNFSDFCSIIFLSSLFQNVFPYFLFIF